MQAIAWVDLGDAVFIADDFEYVTKKRDDLGPAGMKSTVRLRSGHWFYTRLGPRGVVAKIQAALEARP